MLHRSVIIVAAIAVTASMALGQSINIDFGGSGNTPPDGYAGAGLPGVWNTPESGGSLVGLDGQPTGAAVVFWPAGEMSAKTSPADPDHQPLLNDGIGGTGDLMNLIQFDGLLPGEYEIIVYAWNPFSAQDLTTVMIGDLAAQATLGGEWPGTLKEGITHAIFQWDVSESGVFELSFVGSFSGHDGFISGVQLNYLTETTVEGDLNGDGVVDVSDLLILLSAWGECADCGDCEADINGDCTVDVSDLLMLLNNWG